MPRWDPDAQARLERAAYELFLERGYDEVTVAEIAERAGLKTRSFFRYFADKREVLFGGAAEFQKAVLADIEAADPNTSPIDAVVGALGAAGNRLVTIGEGVRLRQRILDSSPELQERELIKMVSLTDAIAEALIARGLDTGRARLTAQTGVAVFSFAFQRWVEDSDGADFGALIQDSLEEMRETVAAVAPAQRA
jgi:AcrR family transcriptional regulator